MSNVRLNFGVSALISALILCSTFFLAGCGPDTGVGANVVSSDDDDSSSGGGSSGGGGGGGGQYDSPPTYSVSFEFPVETSISSSPTAFAIADVNGDNKLDVLVLNDGSDLVNVRLGDGTGYFSAGTNVTAFPSGTATQIETADFNLDGYVDFVVGTGTKIVIGLGAGDGTFPSISQRTLSSVAAVSGLAVGLISTDVYPDIVVFDSTSSAGKIEIATNNGNGQFVAATVAVNLTTVEPTAVFVADVDGDDAQDVVFLAGGDGLFGVLTNVEDDDDLVSASAYQVLLPSSTNPTAAALGDVDGDGDKDIILGSATQVYAATNSNGAFSVATAGPTISGAVAAIAIGSGRIVAGVNKSSSADEFIALIDRSGTGYASTATNKGLFGDGSFSALRFALADMDGSGELDLVYTKGNNLYVQRSAETTNNGAATPLFASGSPVTLTGTGYGSGVATGTVGSSVTYFVPYASGVPNFVVDSGGYTFTPGSVIGTSATDVKAADWESDGDTDLFFTSFSANAVYRLRQASGSFTTTTITTGNGPKKLDLGDVDADGNLDIATANETASNVSIVMNGSTSATNVSIATAAPVDVLFANVDGDSKPELIVAKANDTVTRLANSSSALASSETSMFSTGSGLKQVIAAGLDSNSNPYVIYGMTSSFATRRYLDSAWASATSFSLGSETFIAGRYADMNGDDNLDIVIASNDTSSNGKVRIYTSDANMNFSLTQTYYAPSGLLGMSLANYSGSNSSFVDILLYNATTVFRLDNLGSVTDN